MGYLGSGVPFVTVLARFPASEDDGPGEARIYRLKRTALPQTFSGSSPPSP